MPTMTALTPTDGPVAILMRSLVADHVTQAEAAAAMQVFFEGCRSLDAAAKQRECDRLTTIVDQTPLGPACYLSVALGGLIEQGAAPGPFAVTLHRMLGELLPRVVHLARETETHEQALAPPESDEECDDDESNVDEQARAANHNRAFEAASLAHPLSRDAWDQFGVLWPAVVATYCRDLASRKLAREFLPLMRQLIYFHEGGFWLTQLLRVLDNEPIVVLDPARRVGIAARMSGCAGNDQLHTLLLDAFPRRWYEGRRLTSTALAVANGTGPQQTNETVYSRWNLYQPTALDSHGRIPRSRQEELQHWVFGEGFPSDIQTIEGTRVVLLGPASSVRTWNSARRFSSLPAELSEVRGLSKVEVDEWMHRVLTLGQRPSPG